MKRNCLQKLLLAAAVFFFVSAPAAVLAANAAPTPAPTVSISTDSDFTIDGSALIKYNGKASFATVPKGVRVIRGGAFAGNKTITTVYLPDSVEEIEGGAFENCSNLQTVVTSGNSKLSAIGSSAFSGCPKLNTAFAFDVGSVSDSALTQHTNAPKASPKPTPAVKATALPAARPTAAVSASLGAPLAVELEPLRNFFPADEYHQDYLVKHPSGYCHLPLELFEIARNAHES